MALVPADEPERERIASDAEHDAGRPISAGTVAVDRVRSIAPPKPMSRASTVWVLERVTLRSRSSVCTATLPRYAPDEGQLQQYRGPHRTATSGDSARNVRPMTAKSATSAAGQRIALQP